MGILLLVLGLVAAVSGAVKLRRGARERFGTGPLALAEVVVGVVLVLGSGAGVGGVRPLAWSLVACGAAAILLSGTAHLRAGARASRERRASEGERFRRYVARGDAGDGGKGLSSGARRAPPPRPRR